MAVELLDVFTDRSMSQNLRPAVLEELASQYKATFFEHLGALGRRHPLGFSFITLPLKNGFSLRFHLWTDSLDPETARARGVLHDHTYILNSVVVKGRLRQRTFSVLPDPLGPFSEFQVSYSEGASRLRRTQNRCDLRIESDEIMPSGRLYRLEPGVVHEVQVAEVPCATLVLTCPKLARSPRVFGPLQTELTETFERSQLSPDEIAAAKAIVAEF